MVRILKELPVEFRLTDGDQKNVCEALSEFQDLFSVLAHVKKEDALPAHYRVLLPDYRERYGAVQDDIQAETLVWYVLATQLRDRFGGSE